MSQSTPWVSFCISTYKRPEILHTQLKRLSLQTFSDFEVVISDNDPEASAKKVVEDMCDSRFRYFHNAENLGMIRSFNKSIERANTEFLVLVTDDDPVSNDFLETLYKLYIKYPSFSAYCGFKRVGKKDAAIETIVADEFLIEILDPARTTDLLWSSSIVRKADAIKVGMIPDYGSPHLADHAFVSLVGSINGGIVMNKMFSTLYSHDSNFSKFNFEYYIKGCEGFYAFMTSAVKNQVRFEQYKKTIKKHLKNWFIINIFSLKNYYFLSKKPEILKEVDLFATTILQLPYMKQARSKYWFKSMTFFIKRKLGNVR
jgi:glycosyltransferase involved in cell wall biosynthesis